MPAFTLVRSDGTFGETKDIVISNHYAKGYIALAYSPGNITCVDVKNNPTNHRVNVHHMERGQLHNSTHNQFGFVYNNQPIVAGDAIYVKDFSFGMVKDYNADIIIFDGLNLSDENSTFTDEDPTIVNLSTIVGSSTNSASPIASFSRVIVSSSAAFAALILLAKNIENIKILHPPILIY